MASFKINKGVGVFSEGTTKVGKVAYYGFTGLTGVILPDSVTEVGDCAFENCIALKSVSLGNSVERIGDRAFFGCTSLSSIVIPDSVTEIGQRAFENCIDLKSVTLGDSVKSVGSSTFRNCTGLTSITISDSVTKIGEDTFNGCTGLVSINVPAYMEDYYKRLLPEDLRDKVVVDSSTAFMDNSNEENGAESFGKDFWQRSDFHETIEEELDRFIYVCSQTEATHDDFYVFLAQGYLYRRDEFVQHAVKKIEPEFDLWEKVYQCLSRNVAPYEFYLNLLLSYCKSDGREPNDKRWYRTLKNLFDNEIRARSILSLMNKAFCESNDESFKSYIASLVLEYCEYDLGIIERFSNPADGGEPAVSSVFFDAIQTEMMDSFIDDIYDGYEDEEYDDYKDCQDGPYDCFREDEHHDDEGEPCDDCQDDENRTVSYVTLHNMKDIPSTANLNRMMNEARLDGEREARLRRKPIETSTEPEDSTDKDSSSQWFPGLLVFILILIALAVYFSSRMP